MDSNFSENRWIDELQRRSQGLWHQLGTQYVARILKGIKPADLHVQQPNKLSMASNLETAKALGLDVPLSIRLRADEVIGWDGGSSLQG